MSLLARLVPYPGRGDGWHTAGRDGPADRGWSIRKARRWFRGVLADYRWWILGFAWLVAFALGFVGWWKLQRLDVGAPGDYAYAAYMSFRGFAMNSPGFEKHPVGAADFAVPVPGRGRVGRAQCAGGAVPRSDAADADPVHAWSCRDLRAGQVRRHRVSA